MGSSVDCKVWMRVVMDDRSVEALRVGLSVETFIGRRIVWPQKDTVNVVRNVHCNTGTVSEAQQSAEVQTETSTEPPSASGMPSGGALWYPRWSQRNLPERSRFTQDRRRNEH